MKRQERSSWEAFTEVVRYNKLIENNILKFGEETASELLKAQLQREYNSTLLTQSFDHITEILENVSIEQRESFHQDNKTKEKRHQGRWNVDMMADYCWYLFR